MSEKLEFRFKKQATELQQILDAKKAINDALTLVVNKVESEWIE